MRLYRLEGGGKARQNRIIEAKAGHHYPLSCAFSGGRAGRPMMGGWEVSKWSGFRSIKHVLHPPSPTLILIEMGRGDGNNSFPQRVAVVEGNFFFIVWDRLGMFLDRWEKNNGEWILVRTQKREVNGECESPEEGMASRTQDEPGVGESGGFILCEPAELEQCHPL